jgi:hypothetical protein
MGKGAERSRGWRVTLSLSLKVRTEVLLWDESVVLKVDPVPALPAPRSHQRQRGGETPSHPGGLSETARKRLEEHRRNREKQRGMPPIIASFGTWLIILQMASLLLKNGETMPPVALVTFSDARIGINSTEEAAGGGIIDVTGMPLLAQSVEALEKTPRACACQTSAGTRHLVGPKTARGGEMRATGDGTHLRPEAGGAVVMRTAMRMGRFIWT